MCFITPTMALLAASTAASVGGGAIARNEAEENNQRIADARNKVLENTLQRQNRLARENEKVLAQTVDRFDPQNQQQTATQAVEKRTADLTGNQVAPAPDAAEVPLAGNAPQVIKGAIAKRMLDAFNKSTDRAKTTAAASAYGDVWGGNSRDITGAGRNIDTTNSFSRSWAGLMPSLQDFAAYNANKPSSGLGQLLQGLGGLGAAFAGGGMGGGKSSFYTPPLPSTQNAGGMGYWG